MRWPVADYSVMINGVPWQWDGMLWRRDGVRLAHYPLPFSLGRSLTPAELRAIADVQERWERDHKPTRQVRGRVVKGTAKWTATGADYVQWRALYDNDIRLGEVKPWAHSHITDNDIRAILDLRDNGAWEESLDGGATWTPTHEGPSDA